MTGDLGKAMKPVGMTPLNGGVIPVTPTPVSGEYRGLKTVTDDTRAASATHTIGVTICTTPQPEKK